MGKRVVFPKSYSDISMEGDRNDVCVEQEGLMGMRSVFKGVQRSRILILFLQSWINCCKCLFFKPLKKGSSHT